MSLRHIFRSLAYTRQISYRTNTNFIVGMASGSDRSTVSTSSQCRCPTDEDSHAALLSENAKREQRMRSLLTEQLSPTQLEIEDLSGGCGAMFRISVCSDKFRDKKMLDQHRMVNSILKEEIKAIHAITLVTSVPK